MNELNLYAICKAILEKSKVIEGRFHILPAEGTEINTNAFDEIIKDFMGAITTPKKYPVSLLLPPVEVLDISKGGWSRFKLEMFFLTPKDSQTLGPTNTSQHPTLYDWKDMRECAQDFITALEYVLLKSQAINAIRPVDSESIFIKRYTKLGNDKLNGVSISISIDIFMPCAMSDYKESELDAITINLDSIHPSHKH